MDDAGFVGGLERIRDLCGDRQRFVEWDRASRSGSRAKACGRTFSATCRFSVVSVA